MRIKIKKEKRGVITGVVHAGTYRSQSGNIYQSVWLEVTAIDADDELTNVRLYKPMSVPGKDFTQCLKVLLGEYPDEDTLELDDLIGIVITYETTNEEHFLLTIKSNEGRADYTEEELNPMYSRPVEELISEIEDDSEESALKSFIVKKIKDSIEYQEYSEFKESGKEKKKPRRPVKSDEEVF